jgi:hypothetical protein
VRLETAWKGSPTRPAWRVWLPALAMTGLWFVAWPWCGGERIAGYSFNELARFSPAEPRFYIGVFFVQAAFIVAAGRTLAAHWSLRLDSLWTTLVRQRLTAYAALGVIAAVLSWSVASGLVGQHTLTEDEKTYLFQSKLLATGQLTIPVAPEADAFMQPFIVVRDRLWSGQYLWAQPAILLLGKALGSPWISSSLLVGLATLFTGLLAEEYAQDRRTGLLAAGLLAASPLAILTGGTIHNANLSLLCAAAGLWGITRLARRFDIKATVAVGTAAGLALNNRPLDFAALAAGAAVLLLVRERGRPLGLVRRFAPSLLVALPFVVVAGLANRAVSGSPLHSGYWLFNDHSGWITMGFGQGPLGLEHGVGLAVTKTLAVLVRLAFYTTGSPIVLVLAAMGFGAGRPRGRAFWAPAVLVGLYGLAYFFYAGLSIGAAPFYYDALLPVLAAWLAVVSVAAHDRLRQQVTARRIVPAFLIAQTIAALLVFWPSVLGETARAGVASSQCERLTAGLAPALVFVDPPQLDHVSTWAEWPPLPSPTFDDPVLFPRVGSRVSDRRVAKRFGAGRRIYHAACLDVAVRLENYDPASGTTWPMREASHGLLRGSRASHVR